MEILKAKDIVTLRVDMRARVIAKTHPMPHGADKMRQAIKIMRNGFRPRFAIFEYDVEPCACGGKMIVRDRFIPGHESHRCEKCHKISIPMCSEVV